MNRNHACLIAAAVLGCTATAFADKVHITGDGFDFHLKQTAMPLALTGDNSLPGFDLKAIHQSINAAGISTNNKVTIVFLNTTGHGLSIFALVDSNNVGGGPKIVDALLGLNTTVTGANDFVMKGNWFFNNGGEHTENGSTQSLSGDMFWHPDGGATGMGWTGLSHGDTGNFNFAAYLGDEDTPSTFDGLTKNKHFQFVSWTGTTWNNKFKSTFDGSGSFSFSFAVVPLPPAVGLGLAGLGILAVARRRRKNRR